METLEEAKKRIESGNPSIVHIFENESADDEGISTKITRKIKNFFNRLLPKNKAEKPGVDYYTPTIIVQEIILVYIFICFSKMDGNGQNISESFK